MDSSLPNPAGQHEPRGRWRNAHPVHWLIALCLVFLSVRELTRTGNAPLVDVAFGQPITSGGARNVFAFSGQLTKNTFGVYVVDVDAMTIWTYEYLGQRNCLRLAAARSWRYDRYLENHNVCDLPPDAVEQLIEEQRQLRLQEAEKTLP